MPHDSDCAMQQTTEKLSLQSDTSEMDEALRAQVPAKVKVNIPAECEYSSKEKIECLNAETAQALNNARLAVIDSFIENEKERVKRQEPLLKKVIILTKLQLLLFNAVILGAGVFAFVYPNNASLFFEILRYYIGATVVELIGLIAVVTKGTFSSDHMKIMGTVLCNGQEQSKA